MQIIDTNSDFSFPAQVYDVKLWVSPFIWCIDESWGAVSKQK